MAQTNAAGAGAPIVYNTYQMYLTDTLAKLHTDMARAARNKVALGVKLVRGAYMNSERARAKELGYPSPVQPDIESTHKAYDAAVEAILQRPPADAASPPVHVMLASHNTGSIEKALALTPPAASRHLTFAQLMGMQDATTRKLAERGYMVYKYIPYGPVQVTIPYLQRRAIENVGVLGGGEWIPVWKELKERMRDNFKRAASASSNVSAAGTTPQAPTPGAF